MNAVVDELLECVVIEPQSQAQAAVIWLHGLGADGHDFVPLVPMLGVEKLGVRFVFPHAPLRPISINGGAMMRGWYDISSFDIDGRQDEPAIRESAAALEALTLDQERQGISRDKIIIAGFSQGGALALHYGLRSKTKLAGIMALSTYLPLHYLAAKEATVIGKALPVFYAQGTVDPLVTEDLAELSCAELRALGVVVEWHSYQMGHEVCPQEIADIGQWLAAKLA